MSATADIAEETVEKWQEIVDLLSDLLHVPAALITKTDGWRTEVFVASQSEGNPYQRGQKAALDSGVYCETVIRTRRLLLVPNALEDDEWKCSPDVGFGMISYLGFPVVWPNGEVFGTICVLDAKPNAYGETSQRVLKQFRDVVEADLKAPASERAKKEWERTFDAVSDLIAILDNQYGILRVNRAMADRMGLPPERCVGLSCYRHIHGTDEPPSYCPYAQSLRDGREHTTEIHEDGLGGDYLVSVSPLLGADGRVQGAVHLARDITEQKRTQEQLKEWEKQLAYLGRLSTMAEIVVGLAHELRQPLYAITNYATAINLQLQNETADPQGLTKVVEKISRQARRASDIIAHLRNDVRKCEPRRSSTDINELLNDLPKLVEHELRQEGVSIHVDLQERLPLVCGCHSNSTGYSESDPQCCGCDAWHFIEEETTDAHHVDCGRPGRRSLCERYRHRSERRGSTQDVRCFLYHQGRGSWHGAGNLPNDRRGPRRPNLGHAQSAAWHGVPFRHTNTAGTGLRCASAASDVA